MKTKVIEFITDLGDAGAETLVKDYALLLDKEKFEVVILTRYPTNNSANYQQLIASGIKILSINRSNSTLTKIINKLTFHVRIPIIMKRIIDTEKPDVIHAHLAQLRYLRTVSKRLKGIKLIYTCHNVVEHYFGKKQKLEKKAAEYLILNNDLQLVALHDDMKKELDQLFGISNTVVVHNGIDFNRFLNVSVTKEEKRKELGIPETAFVVGHIGRFAEQKNHPFLIEVFKQVADRNANAFLLMIGAGDTSYVTAKMREYQLEDRYLILSNRIDIPELLKSMDVFVFPSLFEGLGIVLIEAQLLQLKCVVSDKIPNEAIKRNTTIVMSLDKDPKQWCDVIFDNNIRGDIIGNINDYDMNSEIHVLEKLYLNKI